MSQSQSRNTPNTALRKREDKENDPGREAKRNKLRGRRVSFAPDDELETMHLYQKDRKGKQEETTEELMANLSNAMPYTYTNPAPAQQAVLRPLAAAATDASAAAQSPAPASYLASHAELLSPMATPMSMDLTNNSFSMPAHDEQQGDPQAHMKPLNSLQEQGSLPIPSAPEFTRNITSCVPGLSTLVEEDEDCAFDTCGQQAQGASPEGAMPSDVAMEVSPSPVSPMAGLQQRDENPQAAGPSHALAGRASVMGGMSPISPFVLEELRLGSRAAAQDDTEDLKHKWGFTPGAEDTMDVSHGHLVMGEATYNNVYGNGTMGDITRAMKTGGNGTAGVVPGVAPREALALLGGNNGVLMAAGHTAASSTLAPPLTANSIGAMEDSAGARGQVADGVGVGSTLGTRRSSVRQPFQQPEMTLNLLAEEQQTAAWRSTTLPQGQGGAMAGQVVAPVLHETRPSDSTTHLLGGGSSVLRQGLAGGGDTVNPSALPQGLAGHTTYLLGDTDMLPMALREGAAGRQQQERRQGQDWRQSAGHFAFEQGEGGVDAQMPAHTAQAAGALRNTSVPGAAAFLSDQSLTLDDFPLPPELPGAARSPAPLRVQGSLRLSQGTQPDENDGEAPARWSLAHFTSSAGGGDVAGQGPMLKGSGLSAPGAHALSQARGALSPFLASGGRAFDGARGSLQAASPYLGAGGSRGNVAASPYLGAGVARPLGAASPYLGGLRASSGDLGALGSGARPWPGYGGGLGLTPAKMQQQQQWLSQGGGATAATRPNLPPIAFQDFLQLVDIQFLDDIRRRTSLIHGAFLDISQPDPAAGGPGAAALAAAGATGVLPEGVHPLEAMYVTAPRHRMSAAMMEEVAAKLEEVQSKVLQAESALARSNPLLFAAVQQSSGPALALLRDQVKALKSQCRERSHMIWTQLRKGYEQQLMEALQDGRQAVGAEGQELEAQLHVVTKLELAARDLHTWATQRTQQGQVQAQAALEQRQRRRLHLRQLQELQASNNLRTQRLAAAQEREQQLRGNYEEVLQAKAAAQRKLQELRRAGVLPETPAKSGGAPQSSLVANLLQRQEHVGVLLGLQCLALDAREVAAGARTFSLTVRGQFRITVTLPGASDAADSSSECQVRAEVMQDAVGTSSMMQAMVPYLRLACGAQGGHRLPLGALRGELQRLTAEAGHASCMVAQLDALMLSLPRFVGAEATEVGGPGMAEGKGVTLRLVFVHVEAGLRVTVCLPGDALGLSHMLSQRLPIELRVEGAPGLQVGAVEGLIQAAAKGLAPGPGSLQALCSCVNDTLQRLGDPSLADATGAVARSAAAQVPAKGADGTPLRVFDGFGSQVFGM